MTNQKAYAGFLKTGIISILVKLAMVIVGTQISSILGAILIILGCASLHLSLWSVIRVANFRRKGLRLQKENPNEFNKLKSEYESNAEKEWDDPGRVYLFRKRKEFLIRAGKVEAEAIKEASRSVEATHPRYHGTF